MLYYTSMPHNEVDKYALWGVTVDWRVMIIGGNLNVRNYCNRRKAVQGS